MHARLWKIPRSLEAAWYHWKVVWPQFVFHALPRWNSEGQWRDVVQEWRRRDIFDSGYPRKKKNSLQLRSGSLLGLCGNENSRVMDSYYPMLSKTLSTTWIGSTSTTLAGLRPSAGSRAAEFTPKTWRIIRLEADVKLLQQRHSDPSSHADQRKFCERKWHGKKGQKRSLAEVASDESLGPIVKRRGMSAICSWKQNRLLGRIAWKWFDRNCSSGKQCSRPPKRSTLRLMRNVYGPADGWQTVLSCLNLERSGVSFFINR